MPTRALAQQINRIVKEMQETRITLEALTVSPNYSQTLARGNTPIWCLVIQNKLFVLWKEHRLLESKLRQEVSQYTKLANKSLRGTLELSISASSLETRLETESYRFHTKYKKMGGALCKS